MEQANKRIFKNTIALYIRQILVLFVTLYTSRVILDVLGVVDFGIYNVVAGVVGMLGFLTGMMGAATQRFFTFGIGKGSADYLNRIVSMTFLIYLLFIVVIVILAESVGIWFLENRLVIPMARMHAARLIYQFAILSFLFSMITVPFTSMITAHESMSVYAYVGILEAILRLGLVFLISVIRYDKLSVYGMLMMLTSLIILIIYSAYCRKKFEECRFSFYWDKALFKEIFSYSGWSFFGSCVGVAKGAILNILLNMFFGPIVNAARAVASQVQNGVSCFSNNFFNAVRPQLVKSYAREDYNRMTYLMEQGAKGAYFLMLLFVLPLFLEMPYVLNIWLKSPPSGASIFTRLVLIEILIDSINHPIIAAANATGKIKLYQSVVGGILLLTAPAAYVVLKFGAPAYSVMLVSIIILLVSMVARLIIVKRLLPFDPISFVKSIGRPIFLVSAVSIIFTIGLFALFDGPSLFRFIMTILTSSISIAFTALFFGITKNERLYFFNLIKAKVGK